MESSQEKCLEPSPAKARVVGEEDTKQNVGPNNMNQGNNEKDVNDDISQQSNNEQSQNMGKEEPIQSQKKTKNRSVRCTHPSCRKLFKDRDSLKEHALNHFRKPHKCQYFGCSESFERHKHLVEHMLNHADTNLYKCKRVGCGMSFKKENELLEHLKVHIGDKPFICRHDFCGESFDGNISLKIHLSEVHEVALEEEKLVKCEEPGCGKFFKHIHALKVHLTTHSNQKPFRCPREGCSKSFKRKDSVDAHLKNFGRCKGEYQVGDDKQYNCLHEGCSDLAFQTKSELISHQKTIHPPIVFKCKHPDCESEPFRYKYSYYKHLARHQKGSKFLCTFSKCSAAFYEKGSLKEHLGTHSNKRFYCDYGNCKKSYTRKYQLERHKKTHGDPLASDSVDHQTGEESSDGKDVFFKQEIEDGFDFESVNHCSVCEKTSGDDNDFRNHTGSCGVSKFEFMDVDKIEIDDGAVPVKSESEN